MTAVWRINLLEEPNSLEANPLEARAYCHFITHYSNQVGVDHGSALNKNKSKFLDDLKHWAMLAYDMRFNYVETYYGPPKILEPYDGEDLVSVEKLWMDIACDNSLNQDFVDLCWAAVKDIKDRPRYEMPCTELYIEISYPDYPHLTEQQIRQKFIVDWA